MSLKEYQHKLSIIDRGLTLDGSVSFKGQLLVKGTVKGRLVGDQIVIAEGGRVQADTQASQITIGGVFRGSLSISEKMVLLSTGNCSGNIACRDMEVERGGILNGDISCNQEKQKPATTGK